MISRSALDRAFEYRGHEIIVRAPSLALLEWLEEFQAPWFGARVVDTPSPAPVVDIRVDAELFRGRVAAAQLTGQDVACFTTDRDETSLPLARLEDGSEIAVDRSAGIALGARTDERGIRRVDVLAETECSALRLAVLRIVRELASAAAMRRGELPIHGAAVADDRGVTLFVGNKGSGKSTLLVHALTHAGTRFVTNDRAFVRLAAGVPMAHGMPTIVSIREGTLPLAPRLRDEIASGAWHHASTVTEARANRAARRVAPGGGRRWPPGLSPAQLCAMLEVVPLCSGPLARMVFSEVLERASTSRFSLRALSPEEARARLLECGLVAGGRSAPFFTGTPTGGRGESDASLRELATAVPSLHCVLGPEAYVSPSVWEAIRQASASAYQQAHA